jgi:hypothetical protein
MFILLYLFAAITENAEAILAHYFFKYSSEIGPATIIH